MNKATLMRLHLDYVKNNIDVSPQEYRHVIDRLIAEIERLQAVEVVNNIKVQK